MKIGDKVVIVAKSHPHYGESGEITEHATGGPASVGLDWVVSLNGAYAGGCYVSNDEIRVI